MKRKIFVTGGAGMVASYLSKAFSKDQLFFSTRETLDLTNSKGIQKMLSDVKPDAIIHLAALTNLDFCEKNIKLANQTNHLATKTIAKTASLLSIPVIYMSTCGVFDGTKKSYTEEDFPNPISVYGKTKYLGEKALLLSHPKSYIVRSGWIIGGGKNEKKFLSYIMDHIRSGKKEIAAVSDMFGSITYAAELTQFFHSLFEKPFGIYHFASKGTASRYDLAKFLVRTLNKKTSVIPTSYKTFSKNFSAPRPIYEVAKSTKTKYDRTWQESLTDYIIHELKETL